MVTSHVTKRAPKPVDTTIDIVGPRDEFVLGPPIQSIRLLIEDIDYNPINPLTRVEERALNDVERSIRKYGLLQPVLVQKQKNGRWLMINGEHRTTVLDERLNCKYVDAVLLPEHITDIDGWREANVVVKRINGNEFMQVYFSDERGLPQSHLNSCNKIARIFTPSVMEEMVEAGKGKDVFRRSIKVAKYFEWSLESTDRMIKILRWMAKYAHAQRIEAFINLDKGQYCAHQLEIKLKNREFVEDAWITEQIASIPKPKVA